MNLVFLFIAIVLMATTLGESLAAQCAKRRSAVVDVVPQSMQDDEVSKINGSATPKKNQEGEHMSKDDEELPPIVLKKTPVGGWAAGLVIIGDGDDVEPRSAELELESLI